jgi:uridine phosphorylase
MDWQTPIHATAYHWLLGERPGGCLGESLLMLFGNPDLFDARTVKGQFEDVQPVGVFLKGRHRGTDVAFTTPKFGAPAVAMYLEVAAMAGLRRVIGIGYVGGLQEEVLVGDLFLPTRAVGLDGTSRSYFGERRAFEATPRLGAELEQGARAAGIGLHRGTIVSIDALMLETREQIEEWHAAGYSAVDLETACLFGLGVKLGLDCAALHIVSDNPFRGDADRERRHRASLSGQVRLALESLGSR